MRIIKKTAVAVAAAGLAVFGAVATGGGVAHATTNQSSTGCSVDSGLLVAGLFPTCTAVDSTVIDPTSFKLTVNPSIFNVLGGLGGLGPVLSLLGQTLGVKVTYTLECSVDGSTVNDSGTFTATAATQSQTIDLQTAVGSPVPNSCVLHNLKATSLLSLSSGLLALLGLNDFTVGVSASADTAVPGAVWQQTGKNSHNAEADICLDDAANGNNGAKVQVYQCNSDLAQYWVQSANNQLVRNGDCVTQAGNVVDLETCNSGDTSQEWTIGSVHGSFATIINKSSGGCLTAPSDTNFTQFAVSECNGAGSQQWAAPAASAA